METLFKGKPLEYTRFVVCNPDNEIAYVVWEDEGDYWTIMASFYDGEGDIVETIDKDIRHDNPLEYARERYQSAVYLVLRLLLFTTTGFQASELPDGGVLYTTPIKEKS